MAGFWSGTPARNEQMSLLTGQQQGLQNQSIQQLMDMLKQGSAAFEPIAQQARTGFEQNTIPMLAERFAGLGSGAGLSSPSFASQLGQAGAGLEQGLASLRSHYGLQQQGLLSQLAQRPSFENLYHVRQPGFAEQAGQGIAGGIGAILPLLGLMFGGPAGAAIGGAGSAGLSALLSSLGGAR